MNAGLVDRMNDCIDKTFGPGSPADAVVAGGSKALFSAAAGSGPATGVTPARGEPDTGISIGTIGFIIHEGVKLIEGLENLLKILKPSAEAGAGVANADIEVSLGEIFSAIAKLVDIIAQVLQKIGSSESSASLNEKIDTIIRGAEQLERKADQGESKADQLTVTVEDIKERTIRIEEEVTANNGALRELGNLLGLTLTGGTTAADGTTRGWIIDPRETRTGNRVPDREVKQELHDIEDKVDRLEEKADRQEDKLDRQEEKLDREEEKLDHIAVASAPHEGSVASQRGGGDHVTATMVAIRRQDDRVYLRAAIDGARGALDDLVNWTPWVSFGQPQNAGPLESVSIDRQYADNSDVAMNGLLSVRDVQGRIFHREFDGPNHGRVPLPARSSDWVDFLGQP